MDSADWFCVAVRSGKEFEAVEELSGFCRDVRCPTRQVIRRAPDRSRFRVDAPLWDGYLFAVVPSTAWEALYSTKSVYGVVESGGEPLAIKGGALAALQRLLRAAENGEFDEAGAEDRIAPGDMLRVIFGPWEGERVTVLRKTPAGLECEATMEIFGRHPRVSLHYDEVVRAAE